MWANNTTNITNITFTLPFPIYIWPLGIIFILGGLAGIFGNAMIIIALFTSTELRKNRCNTLVGHLALVDFISCSALIFAGINALLQTFQPSFMSNQLCFYISIPGLISWDAGSMLILAIGIDRMVSLRWPVFYKNLPKTYLTVAIGVSWLFGISVIVMGYISKDPTEPVLACVLPTALRSVALEYWNLSNMLINILVVTVYTSAYSRAKSLRATNTASNEQILRTNRLLASLLICVLVYILGWVVTMLVIFLVIAFSAPPTIIFHASMYVGILASVNVGCNFYVYYNRSEEYRRVFRRVMGLKETQVQPTPHQSNRRMSAWMHA